MKEEARWKILKRKKLEKKQEGCCRTGLNGAASFLLPLQISVHPSAFLVMGACVYNLHHNHWSRKLFKCHSSSIGGERRQELSGDMDR